MSAPSSFSWEMAAALGTWTSLIGAVLWLLMRTTIRYEIKTAMEAAVMRINGTYVRSQGSQITGHEIERRLDGLEARRVARAHGD